MKIVVGFVTLLLSVSVSYVNAQYENPDNISLTKKEKKVQRKQKQQEQKKQIISLLNTRAWVIEAHTVLDRYNQSYQLSPTINFVGVKGDEGVLQLGFDGILGWNGVGGITMEGKVTKYELTEGKSNQSPQVNLRFQGRSAGSATVNITVNSSGQATAQVNGDFGGRITFQGQLAALGESKIYKGQSIF